MRQIVSNRIKTPDGTILISRHQHDFVQYTDKITGGTYAVDGGLSYAKRMFNGKYEELTVYADDHFELVRNSMEWGSYGKNGNEQLQWKTLKCMSNDHIQAILDTQTHIPEWSRKLFQKELAYRKKKGFKIEDPYTQPIKDESVSK